MGSSIQLTPYQESKLKVIKEEATYVSHRINPCDWGNVLEVRVERFVRFKNEEFMKADCKDYIAYLVFEEPAPPIVKMRPLP